AYRSMAGPPLIERRIWFDGDAMWIVLDSVRAPEIHDLRQTWQFATTGVVLNGLHARVGGSQSAGVALAVSDAPQQRVFTEKSVISPVYGSQHPAARLIVERRAANARSATVIVAYPPGENPPAVSVTLSERRETDQRIVTAVCGSKQTRISINGDAWEFLQKGN
ncbi:MAG: heparinase II/III family protein, partial [Candidatus Hydrogenedentota bacterium]